MKEYGRFTDLEVYKVCREFRKEVTAIVRTNFPKEEKYLLTAQILDAARSITANISEGHGRYYFAENIRFLRISRGSLEETLEHLITAFDDKYIVKEVLQKMHKKQERCLKLLNGYIRYLRKSKRGKKDEEL